LLEFAAQQGIPVTSTKAKPWSMDENLVHCSYEAGILEDPDVTPPRDMWQLTVDPMDAPDKPEDFQIMFEKGVPVKLEWTDEGKDKVVEDPLELFLAANKIGGRNGVGRVDIVENRFIGLKSRVRKLRSKFYPFLRFSTNLEHVLAALALKARCRVRAFLT